MRTIKVKTTEASGGQCTLQHPGAPLGNCGRVISYQITEIPDNVGTPEVVKLFNETTDLTWLGNPRHAFRFSELGVGKIISS